MTRAKGAYDKVKVDVYRLQTAMMESGMSRHYIAQKAGIDRSTLDKVMREGRGNRHTVHNLEDALEADRGYFLLGEV